MSDASFRSSPDRGFAGPLGKPESRYGKRESNAARRKQSRDSIAKMIIMINDRMLPAKDVLLSLSKQGYSSLRSFWR